MKMDISQNEREKLLRMAYENGYQYFNYSGSTIEIENNEHLSMLVDETFGNNSLSQTLRQIEDHFGFEPKHDWDNFGIYGIIEDASVCYECGARDALEDNECNPGRISHMWDY